MSSAVESANIQVVDVASLDEQGRGVASLDERRILLHGALPGEQVRVRGHGGRSKNRYFEVDGLISRSADRVTPRCQHFAVCGACRLQHLDHAQQLEFKQNILLGHMQELAGITPPKLLPPLVGPLWHYRRKARLSVRWVNKKGRVLVGFRELNGRYVADISSCQTIDKRVATQLPVLSELIAKLSIFKRIPQLEIACGDEQAAIILRHLEPLSSADEELLRAFSEQSGLAVFLQSGGPATIIPFEPDRIQLAYELTEHQVRFEFAPANFIQVNPGLNQLMVNRALELLEVQNDDQLLDLYCGLGNFTLPLARRVHSVLGIEGDTELVELAQRNAAGNGISNASFLAMDLAVQGIHLPEAARAANKILLDPPRSGAAAVLAELAAGCVQRVVYISCNPETLAGDIGQLVSRHGFQLEQLGIMDMFPHTAHIECCAVLVR